MAVYTKDPQAKLDYGFNLTDWLATGETIAASTWTIPSGLTTISSGHNNVATNVWLSGGNSGAEYVIANHFITSAGREDNRSHIICMRNR